LTIPASSTVTPALPRPIKLGNRKYWPEGDYRRYVAALRGLPPPPPQPDDDHLISAKELRKRLGNVSNMWLHRHVQRSTDADQAAA
jgi:hypothetical protein